ncbi:hypothetical protein MMC30_008480 [Trapelia coarctata]|nr:hypothetical protein [Trapelia coarctata]
MEPFIYSPLQERQIRLLRILPGDTLAFEIYHADIDHPYPYIALSYTWDAPIFSENISINGRVLKVTENLHNALLTLGIQIRNTGGLFWADAVCINQQDVPEKSSQVALMTSIYKRASLVLVWLGLPSATSDFALQKMRDFEKYMFDTVRAHGGDSITALASISPQDERFHGPPDTEAARAWPAFTELCSRKWWTRTWIVQEASLNQQVAIFCGNQGIEWKSLISNVFVSMELARYPGFQHLLGFGNGLAMRLDQVRIRVQSSQSDFKLIEVLHVLRTYDHTDPRDKVYAGLGLATDVAAGDVVPDYSKSFDEVYMDVVRFCLGHSPQEHRLDFLGAVIRPALDSDCLAFEGEVCPTWTPDWRGMFGIHELSKSFGGSTELEGQRVYNASKDSVAEASIEGRQLLVKGISVDRVAQLSTISEEEVGISTERSWISENLEGKYITGETIGEAFNHTIVADVQRRSQRAQYRGYAMDWIFDDDQRTVVDGEKNLQRKYMRASMRNATFLRRLLFTEKGYMGLAPAAAAIGDEVCVLFGGQVLYLLRPKGKLEHEFMGEAYVHGLMDGAAMDMEGDGHQTFTIV